VLVDFNDRVSKGQILARIDPSTFEAQIEQTDASIANARAALLSGAGRLAQCGLGLRAARQQLVRQDLVVPQRSGSGARGAGSGARRKSRRRRRKFVSSRRPRRMRG
jgi:HlyD family secretion protein